MLKKYIGKICTVVRNSEQLSTYWADGEVAFTLEFQIANTGNGPAIEAVVCDTSLTTAVFGKMIVEVAPGMVTVFGVGIHTIGDGAKVMITEPVAPLREFLLLMSGWWGRRIDVVSGVSTYLGTASQHALVNYSRCVKDGVICTKLDVVSTPSGQTLTYAYVGLADEDYASTAPFTRKDPEFLLIGDKLKP